MFWTINEITINFAGKLLKDGMNDQRLQNRQRVWISALNVAEPLRKWTTKELKRIDNWFTGVRAEEESWSSWTPSSWINICMPNMHLYPKVFQVSSFQCRFEEIFYSYIDKFLRFILGLKAAWGWPNWNDTRLPYNFHWKLRVVFWCCCHQRKLSGLQCPTCALWEWHEGISLRHNYNFHLHHCQVTSKLWVTYTTASWPVTDMVTTPKLGTLYLRI